MNKRLSESLIDDEQEKPYENDENNEDRESGEAEMTIQKRMTACEIVKQLILFSLPIMSGFCFYPAYVFIDTVLLGRYFEDHTYLVSFGLAMSAIGIIIESCGIGLTSCVETLVSQAFGANDHYMCKVYLNRQFFINTLGFTVLFVPSYFACPSFFTTVLEQRDQVSQLA